MGMGREGDITLRDVEVGAGEAVEGGEGGGHVDAVLGGMRVSFWLPLV